MSGRVMEVTMKKTSLQKARMLLEDEDEQSRPKRFSPPKLWTKEDQFPRGFFGVSNFEFANIFRAQRA
eukprot:890397-Pleurochrysis_carterae.AAC.1